MEGIACSSSPEVIAACAIRLPATMAGPAIHVAVPAIALPSRMRGLGCHESSAIRAGRQPRHGSERADEGAGIAIADLLGDAIDRRILPFEQPFGGFDADPAEIMPWRHAGCGEEPPI